MNRHTEQMMEDGARAILNRLGNTQEAWQEIYDSMGDVGIEYGCYVQNPPKGMFSKLKIRYEPEPDFEEMYEPSEYCEPCPINDDWFDSDECPF
jgi:hypothetical protein